MFTFGMNPAITLPALHQFAFIVIVIIALITDRAEVAWDTKIIEYTIYSVRTIKNNCDIY